MAMDPDEKLEPIIPEGQETESKAVPESAPEKTEEGVKPESPTDKDVEGSSTDKVEEKPVPSMLDEVEKAFAKEAGEDPEKKPEEKPEAEAKKPEKEPEKEPVKEPEAEDLTVMPEEVKEGTKAHERFQKLVNVNKEQTAQVDTLTTHVENIKSVVSDAGLDKDSFKNLMDYAREFNSGDPKKALEILDKQRSELLLKIGEPIEAPDALVNFPDLKEKVENNDLSQADAMKLAKAETDEAARTQAAETAQSEVNKQANIDDAFTENRNKVAAMEQDWAKNDVDFTAKKELLLTEMPKINAQPPEMWPILVQQAWNMIGLAAKKTGKSVSQESPMGKTEGQGGKPEPKTSLEATEQAFEAMNK